MQNVNKLHNLHLQFFIPNLSNVSEEHRARFLRSLLGKYKGESRKVISDAFSRSASKISVITVFVCNCDGCCVWRCDGGFVICFMWMILF